VGIIVHGRRRRRLQHDTTGATIVEFALTAPLFLMILLGLFAYGGYYWRAHSLQQVANDAARAAIAGLTPPERAAIAQSVVASETVSLAGIARSRPSVAVSESGESVRVDVSYDATRDIFFSLRMVPLPEPVIRRSAVVRMGGL